MTGRAFRLHVKKQYDVPQAQVPVLEAACEALDVIATCSATLASEGFTVTTAKGTPGVHPAYIVRERAQRMFARCLKELGLAGAVKKRRENGQPKPQEAAQPSQHSDPREALA